MEGNAPVYQLNPVSRITGEVRAEFLRTWGPGFDQEGPGGGGYVIPEVHSLILDIIQPAIPNAENTRRSIIISCMQHD